MSVAPPAPSNAARPGECDVISRPVRIDRRDASPAGDLTFDREGFLVIVDGRDIVRMAENGRTERLLQNVMPPGRRVYLLRVLSDDSVFLAESQTSNLLRFDPQGRRTFVMDGPMQLLEGPNNRIYVTSIDGELIRLDLANDRTSVLARVPGGTLRGLTFSPDFKTLYVAERESRTLRTFNVDPDGSVDPPVIRARGLGQGADGLATDICGNVYVADRFGPLLRVRPDGRTETVVDPGGGLSALAFGSGRQGWDERSLYAVSEDRGGLYEITIGIRGARPVPPAAD